MTTAAQRSSAIASPARRSGGGLLGAIYIVWWRDVLRYWRDRARVGASLAQPLLYLVIFGTGLASSLGGGFGASAGAAGISYIQFIYPGVISMSVLFTAIFGAMSIVWDREFGFLREMLVAPVSRSSLVIGKCLGGATVATFQGVIMLALAGFVHVPYSPGLLLVLVAEMALVALTLTALGTLIASRMEQVEGFMAVMQFMVLPMFFLSGAVFPLSRLPHWLSWLTKVDPLSYAVDPMRRAIFDHVRAPAGVAHTLNPGMTWGGWRLPTSLELGMIAFLGVTLLGFAVLQFSRPE